MPFDNLQIIIFIGVLLFLGICVLLIPGDTHGRVHKRVENLRKRSTAPVKTVQTATASLRRRTEDESLPLLNKVLNTMPNMNRLDQRIERAGLTVSPERYVFISIVLFVITVSLTILLQKSPWLGLFIGIVVGIGVPHFVLGSKAASRLKRFVELFPDGIDLIVRGLRSGLPVSESIGLVSREVGEPVASVFESISNRMKLGVTMEAALQETAKELHCTEFNFFVTSIVLQRETGGNLSEILNNLSEVLRMRFMMKMKIKAMTSEAKASTIIVGSLPFFVILAVHFMSPNYLTPLFEDHRGNLAALGALLSLGTGIGIMMKMAKFEI